MIKAMLKKIGGLEWKKVETSLMLDKKICIHPAPYYRKKRLRYYTRVVFQIRFCIASGFNWVIRSGFGIRIQAGQIGPPKKG